MSKVVLVINDQGQQRTLTQSGRNQNNFKEETEGAAADQGAAADHDFRLEIRDKELVFIKDKQIHSVVCSLKDVVLKKPAGQNDAQHTPRRQQTTNGSSNTLERAKRIPLPIAAVGVQTDFPTSPLYVSTPSPDSSGFTDANNSGFSIESDGTYSFGDGSPNKVRGRFILADSGEWELVLSEDPDAINLSITPTQGRFLSPSESSESRLPGSPSAGASEESLTDTLVNSPSSAGESKKLRMDHYRLRF